MNYQPEPAPQPSPAPPARYPARVAADGRSDATWRLLGTLDDPATLPADEFNARLAACLPADFDCADVRAAVEQALRDALLRKQRHAAHAGLQVVIACLAQDGRAAANACGWGFFVIERPAADSTPARDVIELRLYQE